MKKTVSQVITIIGAIVAVVGVFVDALIFGVPTVPFTILDLSAVAAIVAIAFILGKNSGLVYIGYLISLILGLSALTQIIMSDVGFGLVYIGFAIMALASIGYFFVQFIKVLGFVKVEK